MPCSGPRFCSTFSCLQRQYRCAPLIIGQAPRIEGFNQKQPFVGSCGKRLFSWLRQAGLEESWARNHALIFQHYLCYPGKQPDRSSDRGPSLKQIELCQLNLSKVLSIMLSFNLRLVIPVRRLAYRMSSIQSKGMCLIFSWRG